MEASTSNRKRGAISSPIDHHNHQSYDYIAKRPKLSVSTTQNTTEYSRYMPSNSVVSKVSSYPDTRSRFSREGHASVRNSKFGPFSIAKKFDIGAGYKESSSKKWGNFMGILERYEKAKNSAIKNLRHFTKQDEEFGRKEKKIEIDEEEEEKEKNKQDDVCEDSGQLKSKTELRPMDSSVVTDVSQPNRKLDLMVLDQEQDDLSLPHCMKLLDLIRERELLSYKT